MSQPQPPGPTRATAPDRRKSPRLPVRDRILGCLVEADRPVRIREIGFGGFATETVEPLPVKAVHDVRFTARDDRSAVLRAQSLHCWPSCADDGTPCYVTGFVFRHEDSPDARQNIQMLIEKVTSVGLYEETSRPES